MCSKDELKVMRCYVVYWAAYWHCICITSLTAKQTISVKSHLLFSKEAVVITEVDQRLVIEGKAAETIPHCKALRRSEGPKINVSDTLKMFQEVHMTKIRNDVTCFS